MKSMGLFLVASTLAVAADFMPVPQQNALVQKYCAVCHTDAHRNGGLTLEHFDAAHADPGVAAMLLSKITSGLRLERVKAAESDAEIAAMMMKRIRSGAMAAAGAPVPDQATQEQWVRALAAEAADANKWTVRSAPVFTASILREVPSPSNPDLANSYRLILTCNPETRQGDVALTWGYGAPTREQLMSAAVDGSAPVSYRIEGSEKMFKGTLGTMGTGATLLYSSTDDPGFPKLAQPLPERTLTIRDVFPNETVEFSFSDLPHAARQTLAACFAGNIKSY